MRTESMISMEEYLSDKKSSYSGNYLKLYLINLLVQKAFEFSKAFYYYFIWKNRTISKTNMSQNVEPFYLILGVLLLLLINNLNVDYMTVGMKEKMQIPQWYITLLFSLDALAILSLVGIYLFRKIAVYLFPVLIMIHLSFT